MWESLLADLVVGRWALRPAPAVASKATDRLEDFRKPDRLHEKIPAAGVW